MNTSAESPTMETRHFAPCSDHRGRRRGIASGCEPVHHSQWGWREEYPSKDEGRHWRRFERRAGEIVTKQREGSMVEEPVMQKRERKKCEAGSCHSESQEREAVGEGGHVMGSEGVMWGQGAVGSGKGDYRPHLCGLYRVGDLSGVTGGEARKHDEDLPEAVGRDLSERLHSCVKCVLQGRRAAGGEGGVL